MRRSILNLFVAASAVVFIFSIVNTASAQRRGVRVVSKGEVRAMVDRLETRMDAFVNEYDTSLDHSRLNGTNREDFLNRRAKDLEQATDVLRNEFDHHDAWIDSKGEVNRCLNIASDINRNMRNSRMGWKTENNWTNVRNELNTLADIYDLPRVGSGVYR